MKRHTMFMDYLWIGRVNIENVNITQIDLKIQCDSNQNSYRSARTCVYVCVCVCVKTDKLILKFLWKCKSQE